MKRNALIIMLVYLTSNPVFAKNLGKYTYEIACKNCHAPNLAQAIKAPPAFDKKAWKLRFKQAKIEAKIILHYLKMQWITCCTMSRWVKG